MEREHAQLVKWIPMKAQQGLQAVLAVLVEKGQVVLVRQVLQIVR